MNLKSEYTRIYPHLRIFVKIEETQSHRRRRSRKYAYASRYNNADHQATRYLHPPTVDNTPPPLELLIKGVGFIDNEMKDPGKV